MLNEIEQSYIEKLVNNQGQFDAVKKFLIDGQKDVIETLLKKAEDKEFSQFTNEEIGAYFRAYTLAPTMLKMGFFNLSIYKKVEPEKEQINEAV